MVETRAIMVRRETVRSCDEYEAWIVAGRGREDGVRG